VSLASVRAPRPWTGNRSLKTRRASRLWWSQPYLYGMYDRILSYLYVMYGNRAYDLYVLYDKLDPKMRSKSHLNNCASIGYE
jgi:hypothetical protein